MLRRVAIAFTLALLAAVGASPDASARARSAAPSLPVVITHYRTAIIEGINIFYREAGPANGPVILLLHGYPTSSRMYRNLIPLLADRFHVIAPDYPGFGESAAPDHAVFAYTFDHYADLMDGLIAKLGVKRYAMYLMDYGAPVGYRVALKHPDRVSALIVQNGNTYVEGLAAFWDPVKAYWATNSPADRRALDGVMSLKSTKFLYNEGVRDLTRIDPESWMHDQALLDRPGNLEIQLDLLRDYKNNVALYPKIQDYLRRHQPPMLIVWGKNDKGFLPAGAISYLRDLPKAELHLLDTGHFALEDKLDEMAPLIRKFLLREASSAR